MTKDLRRTLINGFGLLPRRHIEFLFLSAFLPTALSLPLSCHLLIVFYADRIRDPTPQTEDDRSYGEALLSLLDWVECEDQTDSTSQRKRRQDRRECARMIKWTEKSLKHPCRAGCCNTDKEARDKVWLALNKCFFSKRPGVPAKNKWTKSYLPFMWWLFLLLVPGLNVLNSLVPLKPQEADETGNRAVSADEVAEGSNGNLYKTERAVRWHKVNKLLPNPFSLDRLLIAVLLFKPLQPLMRGFFERVKYNSLNLGVVDFLDASTNPTTKVLQVLFAMLTAFTHPNWRPVRNWTLHRKNTAFSAGCRSVGHLVWRLVFRFNLYPWRAGKLAHVGVPDSEKRKIELELGTGPNRKKTCCVGQFAAASAFQGLYGVGGLGVHRSFKL